VPRLGGFTRLDYNKGGVNTTAGEIIKFSSSLMTRWCSGQCWFCSKLRHRRLSSKFRELGTLAKPDRDVLRNALRTKDFLFLCDCLAFLRAACLAAALAEATSGYDKSASATAPVCTGSPSVISKTAQTFRIPTSSFLGRFRLGRRDGARVLVSSAGGLVDDSWRYRYSRSGCRRREPKAQS
jgi:hypothetical protein